MANAISNVRVGNTVYGVAPEFIYGTQTASTGAWTGVTKDSELFDGKIIEYFLPFAGSGNATLNLTLADGTTTGAKNCYFNSTTRLTTHYGANSHFQLIYHKAVNISGTNYEGWWVADKGYNTDSGHYTTHLQTTANTSQGQLQVLDNTTVRDTVNIVGASGVKVTSSATASNVGTITITHTNSVTAGTAGTSSATSGSTLAVPYVTYDAQGHVTGSGTHTHTVTGFVTPTELTNAINALPEPMLFKGTVGTGGTITSLPAAAAANEGWTYKVITAMSSPVSAKVGDTVISNGSAWTVIPSGDEPSGTVTNVAAVGVGPITVTGGPITTTGTFTVSHQNSGVTAAHYGPSSAETLAHGGSFVVPQFTVNATGHITAAGTIAYTLPGSGNTDAKVEQKAAMTTAGAFPIILAAATATTATTTYVNKSANLTYNPSTKALNTGGTVNGYTLAAASAKGVDTSIAEGSTSTNLPTSAAVAALVSSMVGDYMPISGGTFTGSVVAPDLEVGDLVVNGGANFNNGLKSNGKDVLVGGSNSSSAVTISCTSTTITPTNGTANAYTSLTSTSYTPRTNKTVVTGGTSTSITPVSGTANAYTSLTSISFKPITKKTVVVSGTSTSITPVNGTETVLKTLATTSLKGVSGTTNAYTSLTSTTFKPVTKKTVVVSATVDGSVLTISTGDSVTEGSTTTIVTGGSTSAVATANANATTVATGSAATTATVAKAGTAIDVYTGLTTGDSITEGTAVNMVTGGSTTAVGKAGTALNVYTGLTTGDSTGAGSAINVVTGGSTTAVAKAAASGTKVITGITSATAAAQTFTGVTE